MSNGQASTEQQKKPQVQKTAAARELEDMLKQVDDEEGKKVSSKRSLANTSNRLTPSRIDWSR
jgi:hypothetical protein